MSGKTVSPCRHGAKAHTTQPNLVLLLLINDNFEALVYVGVIAFLVIFLPLIYRQPETENRG